ncbi:probable cytochrome P450 49a1 [Pseudomyrmex gracilis]|uniref:probable cytochrome P450 49a1 n=1 Tax=Pseudomyrmex gracilis TaxID=219809 RepID=UPI00099585EC|nr:probable cytochrome P450 49a1 [Pseudomyrmex gracilis]
MTALRRHAKELLRRFIIDATKSNASHTLAAQQQQVGKQDDDEMLRFRPYSDIPGPKPIPLLGNTWRFLPYIGDFDIQAIDKLSKRLHARYGDIVKIEGLLGRPDMVFVYDADEIERIFRQEERMPHRPSMPSLDYYKHVLRREFFRDNPGVIAVHGESWYNFRSKVQQVMLQPRVARMYTGAIEEASVAFLRRIAKIQNQKNEVPDDFLNEMHKWSLESIARVALDVRLGCLDDDADAETQRLIDALITFFKNVPVLELKIPFWKIFNTSTWQQYINALDTIMNTISKYTTAALSRSKANSDPNVELSLLDRVLAREGDTRVASVLALDLFLVGVDTTSTSVTSVLYQLALHPEKQALAYEEIRRVLPEENSPIEARNIDNLKYVKACIKETLRMYPVVIGNGRCMSSDTVIGGYLVPKGVQVIFQHYAISNMEKYFPRNGEFLPERWLHDDGVRHAFASLPFGYGRRMCLGRRFAELEMIIVISKILQAYKVEYHHEKLEYYINPMYTPKGPLRLRFIKKDNIKQI